MTNDAVLYELRGPAAWLTLNRPDKLNALSEAIVAGLHDGMARAEADDEVKLLVLTGAGRAFSAGFDIGQDFGVDSADGWWEVLEKDVAVTMRLRTFPKPTIAAVHGWCLGGACDLALACDMVVAAEDARFGEPEIRFGSCPVTMLMPFVIGEKKTNELLYTGEAIDAAEAERVGLVNRVVPSDDLEAAVERARAQDRSDAATRPAAHEDRPPAGLRGHGPAAGGARQPRPLGDHQRRRRARDTRVQRDRSHAGAQGGSRLARQPLRRALSMARDPRHDCLFEPLRVGPKTLRNRFYQVPHCCGFGTEKPLHQARFRAMKAEGGWAAVCTEYCAISPDSDETPFISARLWDDDDVRALAVTCDLAHEHGALAGCELHHSGAHSPRRQSRLPAPAPSQFEEPLAFEVDAVVLCTQRLSNEQLYLDLKADEQSLQAEGIEALYRIGDCVAPQLIADCIFDGHRLAREIDAVDPANPCPTSASARCPRWWCDERVPLPLAPDANAGKVALVTGGGTGIGRATALELARTGAAVAICGRRPEPLEATRTAIEAAGGACFALPADVREPEQVDALLAGVLERYERIDVLVNNAGGQFIAPAEDISPNGWRAVQRLNVDAVWYLTRAVATGSMIPARGGLIVFIGLSPRRALPGMAHASAARAAVENLAGRLRSSGAATGSAR